MEEKKERKEGRKGWTSLNGNWSIINTLFLTYLFVIVVADMFINTLRMRKKKEGRKEGPKRDTMIGKTVCSA